MELLLVIAIVIIIANLIPKEASNIDNSKPVQFVEKRCPPHKWSHVEQHDQNGEVIGWKLVCAHCGPLAPQEQVDRKL